jgi:hypothetical protein
VQLDRFTDHQAVQLRNFFVDIGLLERRLEIVCANCRARCDRSSSFTRLALDNAAGTLIDGQTGEQIRDTGVLNVFLCAKCFKLIYDLLLLNPVPLVADLAMFIQARRNKIMDRALKFHHNH